jgi:hypothetical protein
MRDRIMTAQVSNAPVICVAYVTDGTIKISAEGGSKLDAVENLMRMLFLKAWWQ